MDAVSRLWRGGAAVWSPARTWLSLAMGARFSTSLARLGPPMTRDPGGRGVHWVFLGCPGVGKGTYASRLSQLLGVPHISTGDLVREELASSGPLAQLLAGIVNHGQLVSDEIIMSLLIKHLEHGATKANSGSILDGFPRTIRQAATKEATDESVNGGGSFRRRLEWQREASDEDVDGEGSSGKRHQQWRKLQMKALVAEEPSSEGIDDKGSFEILEGVTEIDLVINLKLREDALLAKCLGRRICSHCGGNYNVASVNIKGENGRPDFIMAPLLPPADCASKLITRVDDTEEVVKERLRIYNEMSKPVEEFYRARGKLLEFDLPGGIPESWPKLLQALNLVDHDDKQSASA
ncbi:adenylate kinase [Musa troglodytarum]|uniref:adenylate kinase n=1 Tax=Musa troglodytarum TaxID=320322 RepID=A0A9E7HNN1_9LILI|nr:adenylate kinase [Musa troglodytarum]